LSDWQTIMKAALLLLACITLAAAKSDSPELTPDTFDKAIIKSDGPALVLFYAPWCGHCKAIFPKWEKAATATKGIVTMAKVDADQHKSLGGKYGVQGFPTIKVFSTDKKKPTDYQGPREIDGLVNGALMAAKETIDGRLGKGKGSDGGGGGGGGGGSAVVELTDANFDKKVMQSDAVWIVAFTAPWCGHCKNLMPHWASASTELKGKAFLGNVDATVNQGIAGKYGVQSYPTIKVFGGGKKTTPDDYNGGRTASDIVTFATEEYMKNLPPPEVVQAISGEQLTEGCTSKQICFTGFLPSLEECGADCRKKHIASLQASADQYKRRPFGWVWVEATKQAEMEKAYNVVAYPALVAVNAKKMRFATMRGQFSEKGINEFVGKLVVGKGTVKMDSETLPAFVDGSAWDGSDYVPEVFEEEFDLSDLMDDDEGVEGDAKDEF